MKMQLTRNADNNIVGYKMIKESEEDNDIIQIIRDMYFFSLGDEVIKYDGRSSDENDNTIELRFVRKWYAKQKDKRIAEQFERAYGQIYTNLNL